MNFPEELLYTPEHEWVRIQDGMAIVGITDFAQKELGDIVFVEIETLDEVLSKDEVFGIGRSRKDCVRSIYSL